VRKILAIDIPGGDFRVFDVRVGEHDRGAVVVHGRDAGQSAGGSLIEHEDLTLGFALLALHHLLTVHLHEILRFFDEPVNLGSRHVMVVGQPHENGLAAAPLGHEKFTRGQVRVHGDGVGSLEIVYRQPEGLGHVDAGSQVVLDLQRDNLGVRGDWGWNPAPGGFHGRFEFDIVVDVAVETGVNDGTALQGGTRNGIVHRVAVGLGDGTHGGPSGMGGYGVKRMGCSGDLLQDLILLNLLPQEADVISQAADLGSDLIDQRQSHVGFVAVGGRSVHADAVVAEYLTIHTLFEFSDLAGPVQFFQEVGVGLVRQIEEDGDAR
jgi:hypothetical protein